MSNEKTLKYLNIKEEGYNNGKFEPLKVRINNNPITIKELITLKVANELEKCNNADFAIHQFGQTEIQERTKGEIKEIDLEQSVYRALEGFQKNAFFILINDIQVENICDEIVIQDNTKITFLKLTPLIGG